MQTRRVTQEAFILEDQSLAQPLPCESVQELRFGLLGNARPLLTDGWANDDADFVWMIGAESGIVVPSLPQNAPIILRVSLFPHVNPPLLPSQSLSIIANGQPVFSATIDSAGEIDCWISADIMALAPALDLRLQHPNGTPPSSLAPSNDNRALAIAMRWMSFAVDQPKSAAVAPLSDDHLGMEHKQMIEIKFSEGGNGDAFIGAGWALPERHGRWTNGTDSIILLPGLTHGHEYAVDLSLGPFISPPECVAQQLTIFANDVSCYSATMAENTRINFVIPQAALNATRRVELRLHCPTAISPHSLGKFDDVRQLGLSVWQLNVVEVIVPLRADSSTVLGLNQPPPRFGGAPQEVLLAQEQTVAAVTMVYNEAEYLPIWLAHYERQVGLENCYIIDHGSTDGSTTGLVSCNVIRIPRSPYDPHKQSEFNSQFCTSLLQWFDWVVYSDVDELVMADPKIAPDLRAYCRRPLPDVVAAIGLNVAHRPQAEPALDFARKISTQRGYVFTASSMCKPILTRKPIVWSPGSHSSDAELSFDHLYLFHLRWFDLPYGLRRLRKTREMDWARTDAGRHQRVEDEEMTRYFMGFAELPTLDGIDLDPTVDPVRGFLDRVVASQVGRENDTFKIALDIWAEGLWQLPTRFIGAF